MARNKFARENFFDTHIIDGRLVFDIASNNFADFQFKRERTYYKISDVDLARPDLISIKTLGRFEYWWVILKLNKIEDPYNDLKTGQVLQIPSVADIEEYLINAKKRQG